MLFVVLILYAVFFIPLWCFLVAAIVEIRSYKKRDSAPFFILRMIEAAAGILATLVIPSASLRGLSWIMVCALVLLGGLSLISNYKSRVALRCMLAGSVFLACLWLINATYRP